MEPIDFTKRPAPGSQAPPDHYYGHQPAPHQPPFEAPPPGYAPPPSQPPFGYQYPGQYGYPQQPTYPPPGAVVPSAVGWVIVAFLFFWPLGIGAVINQTKISPAYYAGDFAGAENARRKAANFGKWALGIGIVWGVLVVLFIAFAIHNAPTCVDPNTYQSYTC